MIVRNLTDLNGTDRDISDANWRSRRMLLASENMGFSFHITTIAANTSITLWYKNHVESVYCVRGKGTIKDLQTGEVHDILPGTMYALDQNDRHILSAQEELELACVFNPPVTGKEVHDEDGSYSLPKESVVNDSR
jgi:L-ectoine synthase